MKHSPFLTFSFLIASSMISNSYADQNIISSLQQSNEGISFSWFAMTDKTYQLQSSEDLIKWEDDTRAISTNNGTQRVTIESNDISSGNFYRVAALQVEAPVVSTLASMNIGTGGISVGPDGAVYAANFGPTISSPTGSTLLRIDPTTGESEAFSTGFSGATGNAFNSKGELHQLSFSDSILYKISDTGEKTAFATAADGLSSPLGIDFDSNDNAYVINCGNKNIIKITPNGDSSVYATGAQIACGNGLAIDDSTGIIYLASFSNGQVLEVATDGSVSTLLTLPNNSNSQITFHDGALYVASGSANYVYKVATEGTFEIALGDGTATNTDGPLDDAQVKGPNDIDFDSEGRMYIFAVADTSSTLSPSVIRRVSLTP